MQTLAFGGPWYGSKLDTRLCLSLIQLVAHGPAAGLLPEHIVVKDGMLDLSRNQILAEALATPCKWLLSVDADCSFIGQIQALGEALARWDHAGVALVAAPTHCGTRDEWNVVDSYGKSPILVTPGPVSRIGFGLVAFHLPWYRQNWPIGEDPYFQTVVQSDGLGSFKTVSEDYGHCSRVNAMGGLAICEPSIRVKHHIVRAGHPFSDYE